VLSGGHAEAWRDRAAGNSGNVRISLPRRARVFEKPLAGVPAPDDNPERREDRQVSGGK
jgi:hypothetical protein